MNPSGTPGTACPSPYTTTRNRYGVPGRRPRTGTTAESPAGITAAVTLSSDGTGPYCTATLSAKRTRVVTTALSTLFGFAATAAASITGNVAGATPAGCSRQAASTRAAATTGRQRTV